LSGKFNALRNRDGSASKFWFDIDILVYILDGQKHIETNGWSMGWSVYLVIGRPSFDTLAESDQKPLEVGIHCLTFSIKG